MPSWLSLFNSDDDQARPEYPIPYSPSGGGGGGIKDSLSDHLRGVANFLAPPPHNLNTTAAANTTSSQAISGIKNDLAEIEESFKSSLSLLSTKLSSSFMLFANNNEDYDSEEEVEDDDEGVAGITEEIVDFVRELLSRPEVWTDFPINLPTEFDMSDCQREHAATIEDLVPSLATLREKFSSHLSDGQFWMIYFIILLPRLDEYDVEYLSTPELVEVRETLTQKLQKERNTSVETSDGSEVVITSEKGLNEAEKSLSQHSISADTSGDPQEVEPDNKQKPEKWPEDEYPDPSLSFYAHKPAQNENYISFSDLEEDDKDNPSGFRCGQRHTTASCDESSEWIQLTANSYSQASLRKAGHNSGFREKESESEESNGWHHVDDVDLESLASV